MPCKVLKLIPLPRQTTAQARAGSGTGRRELLRTRPEAENGGSVALKHSWNHFKDKRANVH